MHAIATDSTLSLALGLAHPGPIPARTRRTALIVLPATAALCLSLVIVGWAADQNPAKQFGEGKPGTIASVVLLALSAVVAVKVARLATPGMFRVFWLVFASLLALAAADDMFKLHERLDAAINALLGLNPEDPVFDRLDDVIVLGYVAVGIGVPAMLVLRRLLTLRWSAWFFAFGALLFLGMVITDMLHTSVAVEETLKVLAGGCIFTGIAAAEHQLAASRTVPTR